MGRLVTQEAMMRLPETACMRVICEFLSGADGKAWLELDASLKAVSARESAGVVEA